MKDKAKKIHKSLREVNVNEVRQQLIDGASVYKLTAAVVKRAQAQRPDSWYLAAVTQLAHILRKGTKMNFKRAHALVSEFTVDPLIVRHIETFYDWSLIPD